jgi:plasmid stabilization system protein ParE
MKSYRLTPAAENDIFEVWCFIAKDNSAQADQLESDIFAACQKIADNPGLGHTRKDITKQPVRFLVVRSNYLIVYDPDSEPLSVIRVLHGARDAAAQLQD